MIQLYWAAATSLIKVGTTVDGQSNQSILAGGGHQRAQFGKLEDMLIASGLYERFYPGKSSFEPSPIVMSKELHIGSYSGVKFNIALDSFNIRVAGQEQPVDAVHAYGGLFKDQEIALAKDPLGRKMDMVLKKGKRTYHAILLSDGSLAMRYENARFEHDGRGEFNLFYSSRPNEGILPFRSSIREIRDDVEAARKQLKLPDDRKVFPDMVALGWMLTQASMKVTPQMKANYVSTGSDFYKGKN